MGPKVSINIPAYNAAQYLARAIESALGQTEQSIEIIIVDDGSTDCTFDIIQNFSDSRIRYYANDRNRGVSYTRNRAIELSQGEWIAPLDADDWYSSNRIENLLKVAYTENADLIADNLYFISDNPDHPDATLFSVDWKNYNQIRAIDTLTFLKSNRKPAHLSPHMGLAKPLIRQEFLTRHHLRYSEELKLLEDFHLYTLCLVREARFITVPDPYYFYQRSRQGSTSTQRRLNLLEQKLKANLLLLKDEEIPKKNDVFSYINEYLTETNREIEYCKVIGMIKDKGWLQTLSEMAFNPKLSFLVLKQLPEIMKRRLTN